MGKSLSAAAIQAYERNGYYCPIRVLSPEEARQYRERLERVERDLGRPLRDVYRNKPHLLLTWLADLVRHPSILDAVEDVNVWNPRLGFTLGGWGDTEVGVV